MGTVIDLSVGNLVVDWGKNELFRDHRSLFQKSDVRHVEAGHDRGGGEGTIHTLARPLRELLPRLTLLGYTLDGAREEYDGLLQFHALESSKFPSFDTFMAALCRVDIGGVSGDYEDDHSFGEFFREEIGPRIGVETLFDDSNFGKWDFAYMMENFHPWYVLILIAQVPANLSLPVVWDYFEHMKNGWSEAEDFVPELKPEERFIIVTEGSSDSKVIQKAFASLHSEVLDFFTFIDMEEGYPFSGSGNLASFCRGLIKIGIQNKTIVLFDNDAEGVSKHKALQNISYPNTMQVIRLPDLPELCSVSAIGKSKRPPGASGALESDPSCGRSVDELCASTRRLSRRTRFQRVLRAQLPEFAGSG